MNLKLRFATLTVLVVISITLLSGVAFAQLPTASITGVVQDSSQAAIPGATVTATSEETALTHVAQTGSDGHYVILSLPIGVYDVKAEAPSFGTVVQNKLTLTIAQEAVINFTMNVGSVSQEVNVTAEAPLVDTTSGTLGGLVNEERTADLPLNGRNFTDLTLMQTGISVQKYGNSASPPCCPGNLITANGAGVRSNYMSLDGASMVGAQGYTGASITGTQLGVEGIREFLVVTNNEKAEYGMVVGAQTIIATKGGTNQFHGTAFDYLRNSALDAREFTDPPKIPGFHRNNFGGSFGGPIKKDNTFFFGTYEGIRQTQGITSVLDVPTAATTMPVGGMVNVPYGAAAAAALSLPATATYSLPFSPIVQPYLALYPTATGCVKGADVFPFCTNGIGTILQPYATPTSEDYIQGRVDHTFSDKDSLFGRYTIDNNSQTSATGHFESFPYILSSRSQFVTIAETHVISTSLLNTMRLSFSRPFLNFESPDSAAAVALGGFEAGQGMGDVSPGGGISSIGPSITYPYVMRHNLFTFSDDLSWSHGVHTLKFGMLINHYDAKSLNSSPLRGTWTFSNYALPPGSNNCIVSNGCFLEDQPQQFNDVDTGSNLAREYKWDTFGIYAQDDWRVTSRLTLNLGLRYEISTTMNAADGHGWSLRNPATDSVSTINLTPPFTMNPSLHNFGPRFGFAWDVFGNAKTSVRGGAAYLYDIGSMIAAAQINDSGEPPYSGITTITTPSQLFFPNSTLLPSPASVNTIRAAQWNIGQPHLLDASLSVERALPGDQSISVTWAASRGLNLLQTREGNPTAPTFINGQPFWTGITPPADLTPGVCNPNYTNPAMNPNPRINCNFQTIEYRTSSGVSWYNSLQVSYQKRLSHGLQFQTSYTYSHCLDDTQGQIAGEAGGSKATGNDPLNNAYDYGNCDYDIRHSLIFNTLYNLPNPIASGWGHTALGGWRVGTILTLKTGPHFTVFDSGNSSRSLTGTYTGLNGDRPNVVAGCTPVSGQNNPLQYFNPKCFAAQPLYTISGGVATPLALGASCPASPALCYGVLGSEGRNQLTGPGLEDWDFSITKDTPLHVLGEAGAVEFRTEFFNITNHPNFALPNSTAYTYTNATNTPPTTSPTTTGVISGYTANAREIQFALKLIF